MFHPSPEALLRGREGVRTLTESTGSQCENDVRIYEEKKLIWEASVGDEYVTANILSIIYIKEKIDGFLIKKCVNVISGAYTSI